MGSDLGVKKTILFDISGHGLGHLSISGPVITDFIKQFPMAQIVVRSKLTFETISTFVDGNFEYHRRAAEVTLVAPTALDVDVDRSVSAYESLYKRWDHELRVQSEFFQDVRPDLIVSNIDFLSLAAAQKAAIPTVALCCMNWVDMFRFFCTAAPHFREIDQLLLEAYAGTNLFLQPRPHMLMGDIAARHSIGPIARVGRNRAEALRALTDCGKGDILVLHSLGGWPGQSPATLPSMVGVKWLVPGGDWGGRSDIYSCRALDWPFADIVASVDVVVGKDSYGTVVEAACAGVRLVMAPRGNWPEEDCLSNWARNNCCFILSDQSTAGEAGLRQAVERVLSLDRRPAVSPTGIGEAVNAIASIVFL